jgi:hypothetical protein
MQELIDVIRTAIAADANQQQKAEGVQACRTIVTALDTEPGKPLVLPGTRAASPLAGLSLDQVLDLAIARFTMIADARDKNAQKAEPAPNAVKFPMVSTPLPPIRSAVSAVRPSTGTRRPQPVRPSPVRRVSPVRPTSAATAPARRKP